MPLCTKKDKVYTETEKEPKGSMLQGEMFGRIFHKRGNPGLLEAFRGGRSAEKCLKGNLSRPRTGGMLSIICMDPTLHGYNSGKREI